MLCRIWNTRGDEHVRDRVSGEGVGILINPASHQAVITFICWVFEGRECNWYRSGCNMAEANSIDLSNG